VEDWHILTELSSLCSLKTVYLEGNKIASDMQYRNRLKREIPSLRQIDATLVPRT